MLKLVTVAQCAGCRGYANMRCWCLERVLHDHLDCVCGDCDAHADFCPSPWFCRECYEALEHETDCAADASSHHGEMP